MSGETGSGHSSRFSAKSIKVIAESIGIADLADEPAKYLADSISSQLKTLIQDAKKCMQHSKRSHLTIGDIDAALRIHNAEPQYGFQQKHNLPFRFASGGGRELHFFKEKEMELFEVTQTSTAKFPLELSIRSHWLAIDGDQPTVPENPAPVSREYQKLEAIDPTSKDAKNVNKTISSAAKMMKLRNFETVHVKQLATHELSVEQQLYYKEITEACVGADESRRAEALQSLSFDPGLYEMLPRMCTFIVEGIRVNVVQHNLAILIYLMRMVKALLDNPALYLEKYLHELIPSVMTCILSRQLCVRPEQDNHWALRDFAARHLAQICRTFNTSTNNIQTRITRVFTRALRDPKSPLPAVYGSIIGLSELGVEVIKVFLLPAVASISNRLFNSQEVFMNNSSVMVAANEKAVQHIKLLLQRILPPILKTIRQQPDLIEEYVNEYGQMGVILHSLVMKLRAQNNVILISAAPK